MAQGEKVRVALVHDYLNQFGGAERVLFTLGEMFPEAPIYTLLHEKESLNGRLANREIKTSFLDKPFVRRHHRLFIPFMPKAAEMLNLGEEYDLIISDSASFAKGVSYSRGFHASYLHAPLRYAWEPETYLGTLFSNRFIKLTSPILNYLQRWDKKAAGKPDILFTTSNHIANKIRRYYEREATVIYPPVDTHTFYPEETEVIEDPYYLAFGRIVHFKRFDLVVEALNELRLPLKIIGSGKEETNVRRMIRSPYIKMSTEVKDENELRKIINGARAVLFPQIEDFGLVAAESIACGTPVIAYNKGGALEIVEDGINGTFFEEQTPKSLADAVKKFDKMSFKKEDVSKTAEKFSKDNFKIKFLRSLKEALAGGRR